MLLVGKMLLDVGDRVLLKKKKRVYVESTSEYPQQVLAGNVKSNGKGDRSWTDDCAFFMWRARGWHGGKVRRSLLSGHLLRLDKKSGYSPTFGLDRKLLRSDVANPPMAAMISISWAKDGQALVLEQRQLSSKEMDAGNA
jgi:hypothetical protein